MTRLALLHPSGLLATEMRETLDRRTDLWSFGCVFFEMLTAEQAFPGETVSDIIARILQTEPEWSKLPPISSPKGGNSMRWSIWR